ncbi:hypothetical protein CEXT_474011 [Caerostris extrusa]|uniref:Uncharacterized protein n=1 Tax=Caerostris extrusa TaxID=172846 RepID=A0AAV4WED2_CAEEX|nr:hypothetical protein CEXT_474011 [Caerostris extrusa]
MLQLGRLLRNMVALGGVVGTPKWFTRYRFMALHNCPGIKNNRSSINLFRLSIHIKITTNEFSASFPKLLMSIKPALEIIKPLNRKVQEDKNVNRQQAELSFSRPQIVLAPESLITGYINKRSEKYKQKQKAFS